MGQARRKRETDRLAGTIAIAYIHPGQVSGYFNESLLATVLLDVAQEMAGVRPRRIRNLYQQWSSANVSSARNDLTARFLERNEAEWLLWIDSDMAWDPRDIEKMLAAAHPTESPIVGGLCFGMHSNEPFPTIYHFAKIDGKLTTVRVREYVRDALITCAATGAAFLLIHRTVLEAMSERGFNRAFPFFQETEVDGSPVGEDITFCIRAAACGFPTKVHTGVRIGHHKSHLITEGVFLALAHQPAEEA